MTEVGGEDDRRRVDRRDALVTGVYTFGLVGIVVGDPILAGSSGR